MVNHKGFSGVTVCDIENSVNLVLRIETYDFLFTCKHILAIMVNQGFQ